MELAVIAIAAGLAAVVLARGAKSSNVNRNEAQDLLGPVRNPNFDPVADTDIRSLTIDCLGVKRSISYNYKSPMLVAVGTRVNYRDWYNEHAATYGIHLKPDDAFADYKEKDLLFDNSGLVRKDKSLLLIRMLNYIMRNKSVISYKVDGKSEPSMQLVLATLFAENENIGITTMTVKQRRSTLTNIARRNDPKFGVPYGLGYLNTYVSSDPTSTVFWKMRNYAVSGHVWGLDPMDDAMFGRILAFADDAMYSPDVAVFQIFVWYLMNGTGDDSFDAYSKYCGSSSADTRSRFNRALSKANGFLTILNT